jgi:hypothetical protein
LKGVISEKAAPPHLFSGALSFLLPIPFYFPFLF